ncbi:MAG: 3-methyl-2-oxobutanoate hydroxymethyltransferase [Gammaproteobacteria bacterium]|nr:3-methyl-2-oxobutanoate hydroxymethyltransferase [Gammaproteobacteria bacterium]
MKHAGLKQFKQRGEKITCLTAYDASFAKLIESCGVDLILVGDSLGMVVQGEKSTRTVSVSEMVYHTKAVASTCEKSLVIADMPYQSYNDSSSALENAKLLMNAGAQMIKLEGGEERREVVKTMIASNIPVCAHLGLQPQKIKEASGYKIQGKDPSDAKAIFEDAILLESLGVSALVLECVPSSLAKRITEQLSIPTIGIGAGKDCDGQVLVCFDMLGITQGKLPRFVRNFAQDSANVSTAIQAFVLAVKDRSFPAEKESY